MWSESLNRLNGAARPPASSFCAALPALTSIPSLHACSTVQAAVPADPFHMVSALVLFTSEKRLSQCHTLYLSCLHLVLECLITLADITHTRHPHRRTEIQKQGFIFVVDAEREACRSSNPSAEDSQKGAPRHDVHTKALQCGVIRLNFRERASSMRPDAA